MRSKILPLLFITLAPFHMSVADSIVSISRISVTQDGQSADRTSLSPKLSADASFVAFASNARNFIANNQRYRDRPYRKELASGEVLQADTNFDGTDRITGGHIPLRGVIDSGSIPSLSDDGRFLAFRGLGSGIVELSDNRLRWEQVYLHDYQTGANQLISLTPDGRPVRDGIDDLSISADGRFIVFSSEDPLLAPEESDGYRSDVFLYDRQTESLSRLPDFGQRACGATISADGSYISYMYHEANRDGCFQKALPVLYERATGNIVQYTNGLPVFDPQISKDGNVIVFSSNQQLLPESDLFRENLYIYDRLTQEISLESRQTDGRPAEGAYGALSADGRFVAFLSFSSNVVDGDSNRTEDVFVKDRTSGKVIRVNVTARCSEVGKGQRGIRIERPSLSNDGKYVAFATLDRLITEDIRSESGALLQAVDRNNYGDVYLVELDFNSTAATFDPANAPEQGRVSLDCTGTRALLSFPAVEDSSEINSQATLERQIIIQRETSAGLKEVKRLTIPASQPEKLLSNLKKGKYQASYNLKRGDEISPASAAKSFSISRKRKKRQDSQR